jgi:regulator of replication initiation timing
MTPPPGFPDNALLERAERAVSEARRLREEAHHLRARFGSQVQFKDRSNAEIEDGDRLAQHSINDQLFGVNSGKPR